MTACSSCLLVLSFLLVSVSLCPQLFSPSSVILTSLGFWLFLLGSSPAIFFWLSGLASLASRLLPGPEFPPLSTCHLAGQALYFCRCARLAGCVSPPPPAVLAPRRRPPALLSWAGRGIPPGSWKKQLGPRERPSVSRAPAPSRGPGGLCGVLGPRQEALRFLASPRGLRIWPPPPGQQPKYYSAGGVGGGGRRPRLKEAFRAARPGASCPQARASGRPSRDLRWPQGRGVVVGSLGEGGAIPQGVWWPPAGLAWAGVTLTQGQPADVQRGKVPRSDMGRMDRQEDARDEGWRGSHGDTAGLGLGA